MNHLPWILFGLFAALTLVDGVLTVKGFGLFRIGWLNFHRLKELRRRRTMTWEASEQEALSAALAPLEHLRSRWILGEEDLRIGANTLLLVRGIARAYHPGSQNPLQEARIGRLLDACMDLKRDLFALSRAPGVRALTQFRVRQVLLLARAWKKKRQWEESDLGLALKKYRFLAFLKWANLLWRYMDLSFWMVRMTGYLAHDVVLKILLIRWYLTVAELALGVYRDRSPAEPPTVEGEVLIGELEAMEEDPAPDLPPGVRDIADRSRKEILFRFRTMEVREVRDIYWRLIQDVARHYYPRSERPVYEAKLYDLLLGIGRMTDRVAEMKERPVLSKLGNVRVSHLVRIKDAADFLRDSEVVAWLNRYRLGQVAKLSSLVYKTLARRNPGALVQEAASILLKEAGKRWLLIFIHDKIAVETGRVYRAGEGRAEPAP